MANPKERPPIHPEEILKYLLRKRQNGFHGEIRLKLRAGKVFEVDEYVTMVTKEQLAASG